MRQALLACYTEFGDILKQLAITHVSTMFVMSLLTLYQPMTHRPICVAHPAMFLGLTFCMSRKGGTVGGGWVHPKDANNMAASGLSHV